MNTMATSGRKVEVEGHELKLTNLDKVFYPSTGTSKADVIDYYSRIAPVMVPQATRRAATRKRWVHGVGTKANPAKAFFRKNLERSAPSWVPRADIEHKKGTSTYPLIEERAVLVWLAQVAALEIHTPQWRFDGENQPLNPDRLVLDLDPGEGVELRQCAEVAVWCRELLDGMGLDAFPVTSGSKGLHIYSPLDGSTTAEEADAVARELARALQADHRDHVVSEMSKSSRKGKVFIDWSQNNGSKTTVCPYSLRGRTRPTVAAPRTWDEISDPNLRHIEYDEVLRRVEEGLDPIAELGYEPSPTRGRRDKAEETRRTDRLEKYKSKRDRNRTPEPIPETHVHRDDSESAIESEDPIFVIQEHHASSVHWDFRLEHDGVLASWAVPKGPPGAQGVNRLAVATEDHPLEYATFEGAIPKKEYGGGEVAIWDVGTIDVDKWREGREVVVTCYGKADGGLGGEPRKFALIHTGEKTGTSGAGNDSHWILRLTKHQPQPGHSGTGPSISTPVSPMLATLGSAKDITNSKDWAFEMKWDGVRAVATVTSATVILSSRKGHDLTATFPEFGDLGKAIDRGTLNEGDVIVDGEIVAFDAKDRPSFSVLQQRLGLTTKAKIRSAQERFPAFFMAFDLLACGGRPMLATPYSERRSALREVVDETAHLWIPHADPGDVDHAIALSQQLELEGVVAKQLSSVYRPGKRGKTWIKIKNARDQEVVVIGWRHGKGERSGRIGSLLLAVPDDEGQLHYAGRVGTGFSEKDLDDIARRLRGRERKTAPAAGVPAADRRDAEWVRADLVAEVRYAERTTEGRLRHPSWRGWRRDKSPNEVTWE